MIMTSEEKLKKSGNKKIQRKSTQCTEELYHKSDGNNQPSDSKADKEKEFNSPIDISPNSKRIGDDNGLLAIAEHSSYKMPKIDSLILANIRPTCQSAIHRNYKYYPTKVDKLKPMKRCEN